MCGIAGLIDTKNPAGLEDRARAMADAIRHRGPDDGGVWADTAAGVAFSHRRLSIVDLSPEGHQPMMSADGRYVIVFNGEIYNFAEMRAELERSGTAFRGRSDTEVLLAALEAWGLETALRRANGMFAFALWDKVERTLTLARDRIGKKPLYFGRAGAAFAFSSELKAFRALPGFAVDLNRNAVALLCRYNYIPAPHSIYKGVYKLPAASCLTVSGADGATPDMARVYWRLEDHVAAGQKNRFAGEAEALSFFDDLLTDATGIRMMADVPLGAFLSGGIDSSLIAALMQKQAKGPVRTYSIGFHEDAYNEAAHAKKIAAHLGTDHTEFYVSARDALDIIPSLPAIYDEPFADSSQIPTYLLCRLARRHVTVALSGDGGDEAFYGYGRYALAEKAYPVLSALPGGAAALLGVLPLPDTRKIRVLSRLLRAKSPADFYRETVSYWAKPGDMVIGADFSDDAAFHDPGASFRTLMQYCDMKTYLPDDILVKVDRASMAVALEARAPLLDHRVLEAVWRLPENCKMRGGKGKPVLRTLLSRYVPEALYDRPKQGFGIPVAAWLRGPLKDWAEDLLAERRLRDEGLFDLAPIRAAWERHKSGAGDWSYELWGILMVQAWRDYNR